MDQAKAIINLNEGVIQLEGPVEFVQRYLERYAPAIKGLSTPESQSATVGRQVEARGKPRKMRRSCTRAIRAEVKAGFFDEPRSTPAIRERLKEKGVACSVGALRTSLRKVVKEERLVTAGRGRGLTYGRKSEEGKAGQPAEVAETARGS